MYKLDFVVRILYGLLFLVFGLGKFGPFAPPPPVSGEAAYFIGALIVNDFVYDAVGVIEIASAILLITGFAYKLAIIMLAPIVVVILHYLLILTGNGGPAIIMALIHIVSMSYLIYRNWNSFTFLLTSVYAERRNSHA